jgi:small subunit ribosomal protein S9
MTENPEDQDGQEPDAPQVPEADAPEASEADVAAADTPEAGAPEPEAPAPETDAPGPEAGEPEPAPPGQDAPAPEPTPDEAQAATDETVQAADDSAQATGDVEPEAQGDAEPTEVPEAGATPADAAPEEDFIEEAPRDRSAIPGAHLDVDIVPEGSDPLGREAAQAEGAAYELPDDEPDAEAEPPAAEPETEEPTRAEAVIDLGADARYRATGKRKTAVARVILRPGEGRYTINGRPLDDHFPRPALQRNIRQPLETVGYEARMDVHATLHGGGVSSQAGALRHGISRALIEADPNLRGELKRRGFLTRDPRVKERKKAGLKKARKRPQFSKR